MHLSGQYNKIINANISIQRQASMIVMPCSEVLGISAVLLMNSRSKLLNTHKGLLEMK
jgi:hypothetical protein